MKVTSHDLSGLSAAGNGAAQETQKTGGGTSAGVSSGGGTGDRVDFSSALGSLSRAMSAFGSVRDAKVQALAAQFQSGGYSPDSAAIGRGLVSEALGQ